MRWIIIIAIIPSIFCIVLVVFYIAYLAYFSSVYQVLSANVIIELVIVSLSFITLMCHVARNKFISLRCQNNERREACVLGLLCGRPYVVRDTISSLGRCISTKLGISDHHASDH